MISMMLRLVFPPRQGYPISETPCDSPTATSERPFRKRCRSPSLLVFVSSPVHSALSPVRTNLLPPPKRIKDSDLVTNLKISSEDGYEPYVPREVGLGVDFEDSYEPYTEPDIDSNIQADIDECIAYADAIRARGMDDRDMVETVAEEEVESRERHTVEVEVDLRAEPVIEDNARKSIREDVLDHVTADGVVEVTFETLGCLVRRLYDHAVEILVHWIQVIESESMPTATRSRMTQDAINELISIRVDEALKAYDAARNPEPKQKLRTRNKTTTSRKLLTMGTVTGMGMETPM
ncbi:hypothetical protein Tco_0809486 [Tanacetum coccineum]